MRMPLALATLTYLGLTTPAALADTLRVAHDEKFPPFAYVENNESRGMAVDILKAAAKRAQVELEFVPVPFKEIQPSLKDGRADAIFPLAINAERRKTLDFSQPLLVSGGALFMRAPETTPALQELAGKTLVTPKTGPLAGYIGKNAPNVNLVVTTNYDESLEQLISGKADAAALNLQVGTVLANKSYPGKITLPTTLFLELPLALAVSKGQQSETLDKLNQGLAEIGQDGTLEKINKQWMGQ